MDRMAGDRQENDPDVPGWQHLVQLSRPGECVRCEFGRIEFWWRPASKHQVPTTNMMLKIWQKGHCEHQRRCVRSTSRDESLWTFDSTFLQHITNFTGQAWWEVGEQHRDWAPLGALTV
eukprot:g31134.t1